MLTLIFLHPLNQEGSPYCDSFEWLSWSYDSKVNPVDELYAEKLAARFFFFYVIPNVLIDVKVPSGLHIPYFMI